MTRVNDINGFGTGYLNFPSGHYYHVKIYNRNWSSFFSRGKKQNQYPPVHWSMLKCNGIYFFFFRTDGSFVVHDVPSGSYVVEVISPAHKFEPVRVDITSKGKMR